MARDPARYRFGPLERRGLIAGWRGGQIASVAVGLVVAVLVLRSRLSPVGVLIAVVAVGGGVAMACWPVGGRSGDEWLPTVVRWSAGWGSGRRRRSPAPLDGRCLGPDGGPCVGSGGDSSGPEGVGSRRRRGHGRPGPFAGLGVLAVQAGGVGEPVGIIHDARSRTYTAVLEVRGHSFALLGADEKERRVNGWSAVLSSLARERPVVRRLQWIASTLPDDGEAVRGFLAEEAVLAEEAPACRSYVALLAGAGASTCRHEVHLAVQVRAGRHTTRAAGGGESGACAVLLHEVAALRRALGDGDISAEGVLGPRALADLVRRAGRPGRLGVLEPDAVEPAGQTGGRRCPPCAVGWPWPMAIEAEWGRVRTDGTWQATYWVAEWPRVEVGPDFLGPLLLGPVRRTVSVVMEPMSPSRATRQAEQARTADLADSELRRRGGFLATARRSRESELATRREAELADGHAAVRFSGYVTVTAPTEALLAEACDATEQAAGQCRLELRRLYGDQEQAFTRTLPLCRGLA